MKTNPYWIPGPWKGRLAIVPRPRGGEWLEDEIKSWRSSGFDIVLTLLTQDEEVELLLGQERQLCEQAGISLWSLPIPDRSVPASRDATLELARKLETQLVLGKHVGVHCRQGVGRSAIATACLLMAAGISSAESFRRIGDARHTKVPETDIQREWVEAVESELIAPPPVASVREPAR